MHPSIAERREKIFQARVAAVVALLDRLVVVLGVIRDVSPIASDEIRDAVYYCRGAASMLRSPSIDERTFGAICRSLERNARAVLNQSEAIVASVHR